MPDDASSPIGRTAATPAFERGRRLWCWLSLGYLFFVALPLMFWREVPAEAVVASAIAIVLYLPLHFAAFRASTRRMPLVLVAIAAIGFGLLPFNPGGNTFLIYTMVFAGYFLRPRPALVAGGLVVGLYALHVAATDGVWANFLITLIVGGAVMIGGLWGQAQERSDAALRLTQDEVRRLARMAERERIGRDLHDLLGHTLSLVALKSELAGKLCDRSDGDPAALAAARHEIGEVERIARESLGQVRRAVTGIRAAGLDAELASARLALLGADVELDLRLAPLTLEPEGETALAIGLREAVTNVLRHARASRLGVSLRRERDDAVLEIVDDGRGGVTRRGNGLTGMRERLEGVGGGLAVASDARGTRLTLRVPLTR